MTNTCGYRHGTDRHGHWCFFFWYETYNISPSHAGHSFLLHVQHDTNLKALCRGMHALGAYCSFVPVLSPPAPPLFSPPFSLPFLSSQSNNRQVFCPCSKYRLCRVWVILTINLNVHSSMGNLSSAIMLHDANTEKCYAQFTLAQCSHRHRRLRFRVSALSAAYRRYQNDGLFHSEEVLRSDCAACAAAERSLPNCSVTWPRPTGQHAAATTCSPPPHPAAAAHTSRRTAHPQSSDYSNNYHAGGRIWRFTLLVFRKHSELPRTLKDQTMQCLIQACAAQAGRYDTAALSPITAPVALLCLVAATAIAALWTHSNRRQWNKELVELKSVASQALSKDSKLLDVDRLLATNPAYKRDHVFHDTLNHYQGVQCPYVTYDRDNNSLKAVVRFGEQTRGHPNLVHGGITSLTFDNLLGWLQFLEGRMAVLTAYLHVDFKAPLPTTTQTMVEVKMDRQEGRKLFMVGAIMSLNGSITYATCTSLFVIPKDARLPGAMAAAP
eukprot:TRINITY_DN864_c0_g1_i2.p1 TRINITY_DN864_c0_g1~~TRINITY_DN864_c0_g1_i2.p1  ORF type:complete len:496 (-),score=16.16 TRINITY_DN864_c0_g1_i2:320-1807(-)